MRTLAAASALVLFATAVGAAESDPIVFTRLSTRIKDGDIKLMNGLPVNVKDWPTLVIADLKGQTGGAYCTATFVGPEVLLLAAHCIDQGSDKPLRAARVDLGGPLTELECAMHTAYSKRAAGRNPRGSEDYALCYLKGLVKPHPALMGLEFETLDFAPLKAKETVLMSGYGCDDLKVVDGRLVPGKSEQILRIGSGTIDRVGGGDQPYRTYVQIRSEDAKAAVLCPGDSGGPLFTGATPATPQGKRRIRGVNSSVQAEPKGGGYVFLSNISPTDAASLEQWAREWIASKNGATVCGINKSPGTPPCRD